MRGVRVAVIGGGMQGVAIALELASRGASVDLLERESALLQGASLHNEGKIHLGFVYAMDRSLETGRLMVSGARRFEPLLARWLGEKRVSQITPSVPFAYAVHRSSLVSPTDFATYAGSITEIAKNGKPWRYFGHDPCRTPIRVVAHQRSGYSELIEAVFETEEIALDPVNLCTRFAEAVAETPDVACYLSTQVLSVSPLETGCELVCHRAGSRETRRYDWVFNASWGGLLELDASAGRPPANAWSFRLKYFVRRENLGTDAAPSCTIVLGAFGDSVRYGDGSEYFSWYRDGMVEWSTRLSPPIRPSTLEGEMRSRVGGSILAGLNQILPAIDPRLRSSDQVSGGWILARGRSDVDDRASDLHRRNRVGPVREGPIPVSLPWRRSSLRGRCNLLWNSRSQVCQRSQLECRSTRASGI